jgi:hypothetical protein
MTDTEKPPDDVEFEQDQHLLNLDNLQQEYIYLRMVESAALDYVAYIHGKTNELMNDRPLAALKEILNYGNR